MPLKVLKQYYPLRNIVFVVGEGLIVFASVWAVDRLLSDTPLSFDERRLLKILLITLVCQICIYYNDLYDLNASYSFSELIVRLLQSLGVTTILLSVIYLIFPGTGMGEILFFALSTFAIILFCLIWHICVLLILSRGIFNRKTLILGSGELARKIAEGIINRKNCGYVLSAVSLEYSGDKSFGDQNTIIFCKRNHEGLCEFAKELGIKKVVVALKDRRSGFPTNPLLRCRMGGIDVLEGDSFYEMLTGKLSVEHMNPEWLIFSEGFRKSLLNLFLKRTLDIVLSFGMLVLLFPVILLTAISVRLDSRGPIFFSQERVGQKRKIYKIYKFRSMITDAEKKSGPVWAKDNDDRVTRIGRFLRKSRIDEIPQLWNVLKGEMSFVGPRPEREFFVKGLEYIIPYYGARFSAKPGVTGWAQVCYGYGASVDDATEKLNYDLFYMKNMSIAMDLLIVLRTVKTVISGIGK